MSSSIHDADVTRVHSSIIVLILSTLAFMPFSCIFVRQSGSGHRGLRTNDIARHDGRPLSDVVIEWTLQEKHTHRFRTCSGRRASSSCFVLSVPWMIYRPPLPFPFPLFALQRTECGSVSGFSSLNVTLVGGMRFAGCTRLTIGSCYLSHTLSLSPSCQTRGCMGRAVVRFPTFKRRR
ncbi:hypothetical protein BGZ63DRAFT_111136 [Mariannaea sp. PMI_226]|nr:hypothetical protein BGZ63DRAFT_111136 [Mariannaea sp. PMI_226]